MGTLSDEDKRTFRTFAGGVAGLVVMALLYVWLVKIGPYLPLPDMRSPSTSSLLFIVPNLWIIPMIGGMVAMYVWKDLKISIGMTLVHTLWMTLLGLIGASFVFHEGIICLIIVSPMLWGAVFVGAELGRVLFKPKGPKLNLAVFPLVVLVAIGEMEMRTYKKEVVVDTMLIHAPPAKVWPHVLAFPEITAPPNYWLFRVGLPYPMATTNTGNFAGAGRQCIFSSGVVIKEMVAEIVPDQRLIFDIVEQPHHPEAYGHITLHRGEFELIDNHDGTTTLVGSSWYTLHVRPEFYFNWWASDITHAVHVRVMRHIRELSEQAEQPE